MSEKPKPNVPKVPCPKCQQWESKVVDGRPSEQGYKRKRVCASCGKVFFTLEKAA